MNRVLWYAGFFSVVFFWIFAFIWAGLLNFFLVGGVITLNNKEIEAGEIVFLCYFIIGTIGFFPITWLWLRTYNETKIIEGMNRKIRKQEKKKLKLKLQKRELETKIKCERKSQELINDCAKLNCELKQLENQKNNTIQICSTCGKKMAKEACFCSQCGSQI